MLFLVMQIYSFFHYMQELFKLFFKFTVLFMPAYYADRIQ
jgi:hypothetical protein